nr:MAG TPA: hypothetical protein [Bacteriophage sp.]
MYIVLLLCSYLVQSVVRITIDQQITIVSY